jgi:asparagine synthase (glutamine-hydrolysing)
MDEPAAGPGLFPQYMVSALAKDHVSVVLGGQGGDEIFGGYARYMVAYLEQCLKGAIFETQEEGKHIVNLESIIPNLTLLKQYAPLLKKFWREGLFEDMDQRYFRLIDRSRDLKYILNAEVWDSYNRDEIFRKFQKIFNNPKTKSYFNKMTYFDQQTLLPALLQVEDRVSMAVSLESRVPLLDFRIAELVASMPPTIKYRGGQTKYILKKTMGSLLPAPIVKRKDKMGFPVPLRQWWDSDLKEFVLDTLLSPTCLQRGMYNRRGLEYLLKNEGQFDRQVWGALCLELWNRIYLDGEIPL